MSDVKNGVPRVVPEDGATPEAKRRGSNRRQFLGQVGVAAGIAAGSLTVPGVAAGAQNDFSGANGVTTPAGVSNERLIAAFELRVSEAAADALLGPAKNVTNGDLGRYADHGGTYTKGLAHDSYGRVTAASFSSSKTALNTGKFSEFEEIIVGGTRTLNGPQAAYAFDLEATGQRAVRAAASAASAADCGGTVGHGIARTLLGRASAGCGISPITRQNSLAATAAAELGSQRTYVGPRMARGK